MRAALEREGVWCITRRGPGADRQPCADWTERYDTSFSADPRLFQTQYTWMQLRIGIDMGPAQLSFWVDNVLDRRIANVDALLNLFPNDQSAQTYMQSPRTNGLTVRVTV